MGCANSNNRRQPATRTQEQGSVLPPVALSMAQPAGGGRYADLPTAVAQPSERRRLPDFHMVEAQPSEKSRRPDYQMVEASEAQSTARARLHESPPSSSWQQRATPRTDAQTSLAQALLRPSPSEVRRSIAPTSRPEPAPPTATSTETVMGDCKSDGHVLRQADQCGHRQCACKVGCLDSRCPICARFITTTKQGKPLSSSRSRGDVRTLATETGAQASSSRIQSPRVGAQASSSRVQSPRGGAQASGSGGQTSGSSGQAPWR